MAHQYIPKIFHDPHKNPPAPSTTYLMYGPLMEAIPFSGSHTYSESHSLWWKSFFIIEGSCFTGSLAFFCECFSFLMNSIFEVEVI